MAKKKRTPKDAERDYMKSAGDKKARRRPGQRREPYRFGGGDSTIPTTNLGTPK